MSIHQMFDLTFSPQEKFTINHIARFWEPRVRDFAPSVYLDHYTNTKAICHEIEDIKRQRIQYKKSMTKEERREFKAYRRRFENEHLNPTLVEEGKAFADVSIQTEWPRNLPADGL